MILSAFCSALQAGPALASTNLETGSSLAGISVALNNYYAGNEEPEKKLLQSIALRQAIEGRPEKERAVIALRYYRAYTQQECARVLHVSQVQISRLEKRALEKLRQAIGPAD